MQMLDWGDHLKTGIEIVDRQHKELADLANDMAARMAVSPPISQEEMCALLGCLLNHAESHFGTEEALMALTGVDERHADQHRQTHIQFLKQVRDMSTESGHGGFKASQLLDFLGNWLVCHVLG